MVYVKRVSYKFAEKNAKEFFFYLMNFLHYLGWFEGVFGGGLVFLSDFLLKKTRFAVCKQ
jgi:hypothetical protein